MTENAIQKTGQTLPVRTVQEIQELGALFERSGMFGCKQPGQGTVLVMSCLMSGQNPLQFIEDYHLVDGKPTKRADAMLAKLVDRGGDYEVLKRDSEAASIRIQSGKRKATFTFTIEEAKLEEYPYCKDGKTFKDNWKTARKQMQMLWNRVVSDGVRTIDPGAVKGTHTPEEIQDLKPEEVAVEYEPPKGMTAASDSSSKPEAKPKPEPEAVEAEVVEPEPVFDPGIVPAGPNAGKVWGEFTDKQLEKFLELKSKKLTDAHRDVIRGILDIRYGKKGEQDNE